MYVCVCVRVHSNPQTSSHVYSKQNVKGVTTTTLDLALDHKAVILDSNFLHFLRRRHNSYQQQKDPRANKVVALLYISSSRTKPGMGHTA